MSPQLASHDFASVLQDKVMIINTPGSKFQRLRETRRIFLLLTDVSTNGLLRFCLNIAIQSDDNQNSRFQIPTSNDCVRPEESSYCSQMFPQMACYDFASILQDKVMIIKIPGSKFQRLRETRRIFLLLTDVSTTGLLRFCLNIAIQSEDNQNSRFQIPTTAGDQKNLSTAHRCFHN